MNIHEIPKSAISRTKSLSTAKKWAQTWGFNTKRFYRVVMGDNGNYLVMLGRYAKLYVEAGYELEETY